MAVCPFPDVGCQQEPLFRHDLFLLQYGSDEHGSYAAVGSARPWSCTLLRVGEGRGLCVPLDLDRPAVWALDARCAAMKWAPRLRLPAFFVLLLLALPAYAHVGSKDVYEDLSAGPYKLFVTIRAPNVIPGVATIEVRSSGAAVSSLRITPTPLTGEASDRKSVV